MLTHIVHFIHTTGLTIDSVIGLDARGFLLGPWIASELNASFVPIRKAGKLPGETEKIGYEKEYGTVAFVCLTRFYLGFL